MSRLLYFIKRHNSMKDFIKIAIAVLYCPIILFAWICSFFYKKIPNDVWLIGELGIDAKDNGFAFFKFINEKHPEINSIYYIDNQMPVYSTVERVGRTVQFNSFEHMVAFMKAKFVLSTQDMYPLPWGRINWREFKLVYPWIAQKKKFVFLQHGITKDDAVKNSNYGRTRFDYFVTAVHDEFKEISSSKYGYTEGQVIETGFPRFDDLFNNRSRKTKNEILVMPTWRQYLADVSAKEFIKSKYYLTFNTLFNDKDLITFLKKNKLILAFFPPHREIQKFLSEFSVLDTSVIRLVNVDKESVSELIMDSKLMITDYSSVAFDFAFMRKPVIYYQFDQVEFRSGHYKEGYFSYQRDGLGPVVTTVDELKNEIQRSMQIDFKMQEKYEKRNNDFFDLRDNKNSERLFQNLINK